MDIQRINMTHHFYYCLLVAVKIYRQERGLANKVDENAFIYCWLNKAASEAVFDYSLQAEIIWLKSQLKSRGITANMLAIIEPVFVKLNALLNEVNKKAV